MMKTATRSVDAAADAAAAISASALVRALRAGELSAAEAVDAHIERIDRVDRAGGRLNAVVTPLFEDARARARMADAVPPDRRGPLHGLPVTVKECFDVAGTPSTAGLESRRNHRAETDAPLVARLREAGAIILGKTNVSQLLMFVESDNPVYGRTNNPWHLGRSAGGSSGGEAAIVAAGGSSLGLGTDVGGSVRVPAHSCGVQSFKPTPGVLPATGTVEVVGRATGEAIPDSGGLIAREVGDLRLALDVLAPALPTQPLAGLRNVRVGYYEEDGYFPASPAIRRAVREAAAALEAAGLAVKPFSPPAVDEALAVFYGLFGADGGAHWRSQLAGGRVDPRIGDLLSLTGIPRLLRPTISTLLRLQGQPGLARAVASTGAADAAREAALVGRRDAYRRRFAEAMRTAGVDVLLCPPAAVPAVPHGATRVLGPASVSYTCLYNLLAYPAGVVSTTTVRPEETASRPRSRERAREAARGADTGSAGLPVGVQVAAPTGRDGLVLAVMQALEERFPRPTLPTLHRP